MLTHAYNASIWKTKEGGLSELPAWPKREPRSIKKTSLLGKAEGSQIVSAAKTGGSWMTQDPE